MASMNQSARSIPVQTRAESGIPVRVPRILMSWEDWLTFAAVVTAFMAVAYSIQQSEWVDNMPPLWPTVGGGLVIGLVAARVRFHALLIQPVALVLGLVIVVAMVQTYATGDSPQERIGDVRERMQEWWAIVRAGEISNDNLPFVFLVHSVACLAAYFASWSIFRWHFAWLALVPGAVVLLSNISFQREQPAAAFVVFIIAAMLIVARTYLQQNQRRWKRDGVRYPEFISLDALTLTVLLAIGLVVVAWQVPLADEDDVAEGAVDVLVRPFEPLKDDAVRLFSTVNGGNANNLHSFGDTLPILGEVEFSNRRLFTVQSAVGGFVRATSYDRYTGAGWQSTDRETERFEGEEFLDRDSGGYRDRAETLLRVEVIDDESTLLSLGIPQGTNLRAYVDTPEEFAGDIERLRSVRALDRGDTYNVVGSVSLASPEALQGAGTSYPGWVSERYLQLPEDLPQTVVTESRRIAGEYDNPYDQAVAVRDYLRTFEYSLDVALPPPNQDLVEYLLLDVQQGHFDYQATAMAVMLRTLGVPARIAVGYVLDPLAIENGAFTVRETNAFAWVEVFFPEYGWITFNPTSLLPGGGASEDGDAGFGSEELPGGFLDPGIDLLGGADIPPGELGGPVNPDSVLGEAPVDQQPAPWWILWTALAVLGALAVATAGGWLSWNWGMAGLDGRSQQWAKTQRLARWAKLGSHPGETPSEWGSRLGESLSCEQAARALTETYQEERYGGGRQRIGADMEADAAYRELRGALLAKVLRWKRRTPPGAGA